MGSYRGQSQPLSFLEVLVSQVGSYFSAAQRWYHYVLDGILVNDRHYNLVIEERIRRVRCRWN
jgi:hypothetical protein